MGIGVGIGMGIEAVRIGSREWLDGRDGTMRLALRDPAVVRASEALRAARARSFGPWGRHGVKVLEDERAMALEAALERLEGWTGPRVVGGRDHPAPAGVG